MLTPESPVDDTELPRGECCDGPQDQHNTAEGAAPLDDPPLGVRQLGGVVLVVGKVGGVVLN